MAQMHHQCEHVTATLQPVPFASVAREPFRVSQALSLVRPHSATNAVYNSARDPENVGALPVESFRPLDSPRYSVSDLCLPHFTARRGRE